MVARAIRGLMSEKIFNSLMRYEDMITERLKRPWKITLYIPYFQK